MGGGQKPRDARTPVQAASRAPAEAPAAFISLRACSGSGRSERRAAGYGEGFTAQDALADEKGVLRAAKFRESSHAAAAVEQVRLTGHKVEAIDIKPTVRQPQPPFTTSTLQQAADVVMFLHRERSDDDDDASPTPSEVTSVELHIAKQRNGPTGEARLVFHGGYTRFESASGR